MTSRVAAWVLALSVIGGAACGHYGPPVRSKPEGSDAAPAPYDAPTKDEDASRKHHEP